MISLLQFALDVAHAAVVGVADLTGLTVRERTVVTDR
jgi:hypothetical protein